MAGTQPYNTICSSGVSRACYRKALLFVSAAYRQPLLFVSAAYRKPLLFVSAAYRKALLFVSASYRKPLAKEPHTPTAVLPFFTSMARQHGLGNASCMMSAVGQVAH